MFSNRITKAGLGMMLSVVMLATACDPTEEAETAKEKAARYVREAKTLIAKKKYSDAQRKCEAAEQLDPSLEEAPYCVMVANVGALVQSVASIISLAVPYVSGNAPAYTSAAGINVKSIAGSIFSDIEGQMAYIDSYAYKLAAFDNPKFTIDEFVLALDPADLLELMDSGDIKITGDLALNMKGTWDKTEALALGALVNAVQGLLDYLMAHKLNLASIPSGDDFKSTGAIAEVLFKNADLFAKDPDDEARLKGGENRKGIKNEALAALSFLLGRDAELEGVSPVHSGLKEAIAVSAAEADPKSVVVYTDADGDGIPESISIPALSALQDSITGFEIPTEIENPLSSPTWEKLITEGKKVVANIEAGGKTALPATELLQTIVDEMKTEHPTTRVLLKDVPNAIAVNPGAFLANPKYLSELLPVYFHYTTDTTKAGTQLADLAIEVERYASTNQLEAFGKAASSIDPDLNGDFYHFDYAVATRNKEYRPAFTTASFADFNIDLAGLPLAADGVTATAKTPNLYYILLSDASIGGAVHMNADFDATGKGGTFAAGSNEALNKGLNKLIKYYCINTDIADVKDADGKEVGLLGIFDDENYPADNKIADCN